MSSKRLLRLIGSIDDEFILNAAEYHPTKVRKLNTALVIGIVASVACITLLFTGIFRYIEFARNYEPKYQLRPHGIKSESVVYFDQDWFGTDDNTENSNWTNESNVLGIDIELRIDSINDSTIEGSYVIDDDRYTDDKLYFFANCFRLVNDDQEDLIDSPPADPKAKTFLASETHFTVDILDEYSPLEPGKYTLYGYIFNENGDYDYIAVEFMVP